MDIVNFFLVKWTKRGQLSKDKFKLCIFEVSHHQHPILSARHKKGKYYNKFPNFIYCSVKRKKRFKNSAAWNPDFVQVETCLKIWWWSSLFESDSVIECLSLKSFLNMDLSVILWNMSWVSFKNILNSYFNRHVCLSIWFRSLVCPCVYPKTRSCNTITKYH